ncbi:glycosyltransferase [Pseudocolwellia sp. HL-MZ19]|uniref:glycosyltransferase n=1 Tax=Pseudocolwellia sp. HL-MZ19 TaxID=3400846 RepID=UPI003CEBEA38
MIFVTVGTQFSFPRLLNAINAWASDNPHEKIVAQTGNTDEKYQHLEEHKFLSTKQYTNYLRQSSLIVGHAGTGTIISALEKCLPCILMVRDYKKNEHRSGHQSSMANYFKDYDGLYFIYSEYELFELLNCRNELVNAKPKTHTNKNLLIDYLGKVISKGKN